MSDELKRGAATDVAPDDVLARDAFDQVLALGEGGFGERHAESPFSIPKIGCH